MGPPLIEMFAAELRSDYALAGTWEEAHAYAQRVLESRTDTIVLSKKLTLCYEIEALVREGEIEQAQAAFKQAATMVLKLADTLGSAEQRANFLATPLVQRVLER